MEVKLRNAMRSLGALQMGQKWTLPQEQLLSLLTEKADTSYSILLAEHLNRMTEENLDQQSEFLGEFRQGQSTISLDIDVLREEIKKRFDELKSKWMQRFSNAEVSRIIDSNHWLETVEDHYRLKFPAKKKDVRDYFYQSFHIMVGDVEKIVVMTGSRLQSIQDRNAKLWHSQLGEGSAVRLLPSLELVLRKAESDAMAQLRSSLGDLALQFFYMGLKASRSTKFSHPKAAVIRVGELWNPRARYNNNFQGYTKQFTDLAEAMCLEQCEFYLAKWHLFFRGFSSGQINLFNPTPQYPRIGEETAET